MQQDHSNSQSKHHNKLEKQDQMLKHPLLYQKRRCTDVCCLIIGLAFTVILLILSFILYRSDHLSKTSLPSDSEGKICGIDYPSYSFVYFTNPPQINSRVCVSSCPLPGDAKLLCAPTATIGCKFSDTPGFTVQYYDNTAVRDSNGNICLPTDEALKQQIQENANLDNRSLFFKSFYVLQICLLISVGLSILFYVIVQIFPSAMLKVTIVLSLVVILALSIVLYLYKTDNTKSKIIIAILLFLLFLVTLASTLAFRSAFSLSAVFLKESTKFSSKNRGTLLYIPIFFSILFGFFILIIQQYRGLVSFGTPQFNPNNLYYQVSKKGLFFTVTVLLIHLIWGFSFIKQAFNFVISFHAIRFYFGKNGGICYINDAFKLLIFKHLGSVIAASFINAFLFIPDTIMDIFKLCFDIQFPTLDLVRSDAVGYVALTGSPFCNSARYCEYLVFESSLSDYSQSIFRTYRISAHIFLAGIVSVVGLYFKGTIEPYTVAATFVLGIFISTFMVSYNADVAQTLMMMHFVEEQYYKRSNKKDRFKFDVQNKQGRNKYLQFLTKIHKRDAELTDQIKSVRKQQWNQKEAQQINQKEAQ